MPQGIKGQTFAANQAGARLGFSACGEHDLVVADDGAAAQGVNGDFAARPFAANALAAAASGPRPRPAATARASASRRLASLPACSISTARMISPTTSG